MMSDPIIIPGVRVGQVWQEVRRRKGRNARRVEVTGLGMYEVFCVAVNGEGERFGSLIGFARDGWEDRYSLVSEGSAQP
jgi:hypothetical protein